MELSASPITQSFLECPLCHYSSALTLFQTENFRVALEPFPLMEGHLLIHPKAHIGCAGELNDFLLVELREIKLFLTVLLENSFGSAALYEYGRVGISQHMCLHALPLDADIAAKNLEAQFQRLKIQDFFEIQSHFDRFGDYIFWETASREKSFFCISGFSGPPPIRAWIAESIGHAERALEEEYLPNPLIENTRKSLFGKMESFSALAIS